MKTLYFILFIDIFLSCNHKDDSAVPNEYAAKFVRDLNSSDTFLYELPLRFSRSENTVDSFKYNSLLKTHRMLDLKSLENGIDSIQIRISDGCSLMSDWLMIVFNHNGQKWTAEVSRVTCHFNTEKEVIDSMSRKISSDRPKSGWVEFLNKLFDLKILSLNNQTVIPIEEYTSPNDGCDIVFEIATKNVYRFYGYGNPEMQNQKIWQVSNVIAIKELLYNEFSVLKNWKEEIEDDFYNTIEKHQNKIKNDIENQKSENARNNGIIIHEVSDTTLIKQ